MRTLRARFLHALAIPKAVRAVDLNGDAVDDFVLYAGSMVCEDAGSVYGDREKALMVYAGDGRGE